MAFNPTLPVDGSLMVAGEMRNQFNGLAALIAAVPAGPAGPAGPQGEPGPAGPVGPMGEVTPGQLDAAVAGGIAACAANPQGVSTLSISVSDPPTTADVVAVVDKLNELIVTLRRG